MNQESIKGRLTVLFRYFYRRPRLYSAIILMLIVLLILLFLIPPVWKLKNGPIAVLRWPKSGPQYFSVGPQQAQWVPLAAVSKHVIHAIVVSEDARFYDHFGLDLKEIQNSVVFNVKKKRFARGASTITQQVVKMAFLDNDKNILRKFREALGAVVLEFILNKDDVLGWYINLVEFGDGIFGIKEAAHHFFQTEPEVLTIQNGAHLALILPSPNRWGKALKQKELTEYGQRRYASIIDQMFNLGFITNTLRETALATGDFGRPIIGYETQISPEEVNGDPYYAMPGQEPPPFGHEPVKKKHQKFIKVRIHNHNIK